MCVWYPEENRRGNKIILYIDTTECILKERMGHALLMATHVN